MLIDALADVYLCASFAVVLIQELAKDLSRRLPDGRWQTESCLGVVTTSSTGYLGYLGTPYSVPPLYAPRPGSVHILIAEGMQVLWARGVYETESVRYIEDDEEC